MDVSRETLRFHIVARRGAAEVAEERIRLGFRNITIMHEGSIPHS